MLIHLNNKRSIILKQIEQWGYAEGFLEGGPDKAWNDNFIAGLKNHWIRYSEHTYIIPPEERKIQPSPIYARWERIAESLPSIVSLARFESIEYDSDYDGSTLVIGWFQEKFGLPPEKIQEAIKNIDWANHAEFWHY